MKLFEGYLKETEDAELVRSETGFAVFKMQPDGSCWIRDIYVMPEHREAKAATALADAVCEIVKPRGVKRIVGSVSIHGKSVTRSIQVLEGYGMAYRSFNPAMGLLIFDKELS